MGCVGAFLPTNTRFTRKISSNLSPCATARFSKNTRISSAAYPPKSNSRRGPAPRGGERGGGFDSPELRLPAPVIQPPARRPQPALEPVCDQHQKRGWLQAAGLRRKLARYFSKLGSISLFVPRICREHDQHFSECHHGRWVQPVSNYAPGSWIGNCQNRIIPGRILAIGAIIKSFTSKS